MAAITVSRITIADAAIDPDSPITQALLTGLRDNIEWVIEWVGASYAANAVQDHDHDGTNSTLIVIGPNQIRNGSFDGGVLTSWTFVDSADGSAAADTTNHRHGDGCVAITSITLANGGSVGTQNGFTAIAEGDPVTWRYWVYGSIANISSKLDIEWYQADQSTLISTVLLNQDTATPTSYTLKHGAVIAPANARYFRLKITGGIASVGTAVGTIYVDGINAIDIPPIQEANMAAASVNQAALKTATSAQSVSVPGESSAAIALTGSTYSFLTFSGTAPGGLGGLGFGAGNTAAGTLGFGNTDSVSKTAYVDTRYLQASPPWRFGSGPTETDEIELFAMLILERATGRVLGISVAADPPWAYNGPTIITPTHYGRARDQDDNDILVPMRREIVMPHSFQDTKGNPAKRAEYDAALAARVYRDVAIDMDYKNRDMAVIPHCWQSGSAIDDPAFPTAVPVMLNPFNDGMFKLRHLLETGENIYEIFENDFLDFKQPVAMPGGPPGVAVIDWSWK